MSTGIKINNVVKRYGDHTVVKGLSLDIKEGEFFTLLGPSGCGKTTLLRMIIGFNSIEEGEIYIGDTLINDVPVNKRNMGMVFQNYAIFPHMNVWDNVAFGLKKRNLSKEEIKERVEKILKIVKIETFKNRMPDQLSGGQQQRVALARSIVIQPNVLLMDEPLSNLDAKLRIEMRNAIKTIQQDIGITTVYVTHDQEEALAVSDRIAVMNQGIIQQVGTPVEIYNRPLNIFVSKFIGTSNVIKAELKALANGTYSLNFGNNYVETMDNIQSGLSDQTVLASVRPNEFIINNEKGIPAKVLTTMFLGMNTHYFVELQNGEVVEAVEDTEHGQLLAKGSQVLLKVKPRKINIYDQKTENTLIELSEKIG